MNGNEAPDKIINRLNVRPPVLIRLGEKEYIHKEPVRLEFEVGHMVHTDEFIAGIAYVRYPNPIVRLFFADEHVATVGITKEILVYLAKHEQKGWHYFSIVLPDGSTRFTHPKFESLFTDV